MQTRHLGNTDLELTTIGLGTWALGGAGWEYSWGPQDDRQSIETIHHCLDVGVNWLDTAPVYGLGHSEEVVGKALKGLSQKPIVATKCGRTWKENEELAFDLTPDGLRDQLENSLRRLQIETIDLYQIHWPVPDEQLEEAWGTLSNFVKEGKVRYLGVSNFSMNQIKRIMDIHPVASLQPPYSIIVNKAEKDLLPFCGEHDIGVVCYSPMYKGLLTGKMTRERLNNLPDSDHRTRDPQFREPLFKYNLALVEGLRGIAENRGVSVAQIALAWVLRRPEVTSAIAGGRKRKQIEETAAAGDIELTQEEVGVIDTLIKKREAKVSD